MGLQTVGLVSDMGGSNDRFYSYLRDGSNIDVGDLWPKDQVVVANPIDAEQKLHMWSCSTHGLKNIRSQVEMSRRDGSGSRQFITTAGIPFGWWTNQFALDRDNERLSQGAEFQSTLSMQAVNLDSFSKMNASLAKQPFTSKTLGTIIKHCAISAGGNAEDLILAAKSSDEYTKAGSGEKLLLQLQALQRVNLPEDKRNVIQSDIAYLEVAVTVHRIYNERFMNNAWGLTRKSIDSEEEQLKDCLQFLETWRQGTKEYQKDDESIRRQVRERFFLSTKTYRNMKFAICGFVQYARHMLHALPSNKIQYVNSGHSNTSALESRFSIAKRSGLNDTAKYHLVAANMNSVATMKHKKRHAHSKRRKAGNSSYPAEQIAPELHEAASVDFTVGKLVEQRKKKVESYFEEWSMSKKATAVRNDAMVLELTQEKPVTKVCKFLLPLFVSKAIPEGSFVEMWRNEETIRDLMVLTVDSEHWESLRMLFSSEGATQIEVESKYMAQLAFKALDSAMGGPKLSCKSSFWWQVMKMMRDGSLHRHGTGNCLSKLIRAYLFQLTCGKIFAWARELLDGSVEKAGIRQPKQELLPGAEINYSAIASDVNTFVGYSLFSLKRKYGVIEELATGIDEEDKYWLLTDMMARESDIRTDKAYMSMYYDTYYVVLNRGDMTLVAPRYIKFFHGVLYQIARSVNMKNMVEDTNKFMSNARAEVNHHVPAWSKTLKILSDGVHLVNPEKSCHELLKEIVEKTFNSKASAVLKRYRSMFLARGGKQASQSSLRDTQKHSGLGRQKTGKKKGTPSRQPQTAKCNK